MENFIPRSSTNPNMIPRLAKITIEILNKHPSTPVPPNAYFLWKMLQVVHPMTTLSAHHTHSRTRNNQQNSQLLDISSIMVRSSWPQFWRQTRQASVRPNACSNSLLFQHLLGYFLRYCLFCPGLRDQTTHPADYSASINIKQKL